MNLSEEQRQRLADSFINLDPRDRGVALDGMRAKGIDFDIYEYMPIHAIDEYNNAMEFAKEAVTFGAYNAKPIANAGDFEIMGHEIQPSALAGEVVGAMPGIVAGYGIGGAVARSAVTGARVLSKAAAPTIKAARSVRRARTAVRMTIGEGLPGSMNGYIRSDGDINQALVMAAEWTAGGLLMEGAFSGIKRAFGKVKSGLPTTEADRNYLQIFHEKLNDGAKSAGHLGTQVSDKVGDVLDGVLNNRFVQMSKSVVNGEMGQAEYLAGMRSMSTETMDRMSNWSTDAKALVNDGIEKHTSAIYEKITTPGMREKLTPDELRKEMSKILAPLNGAQDVVETYATQMRNRANQLGSTVMDKAEKAVEAHGPDGLWNKLEDAAKLVEIVGSSAGTAVERSVTAIGRALKEKIQASWSKQMINLPPRLSKIAKKARGQRVFGAKDLSKLRSQVARSPTTDGPDGMLGSWLKFRKDGNVIFNKSLLKVQGLEKDGQIFARQHFERFQKDLYKKLEDADFSTEEIGVFYDGFFTNLNRLIDVRIDKDGVFHNAAKSVNDFWNTAKEKAANITAEAKVKVSTYVDAHIDEPILGGLGEWHNFNLFRGGKVNTAEAKIALREGAKSVNRLLKKAYEETQSAVGKARVQAGEISGNMPSREEFMSEGHRVFRAAEKNVRVGAQALLDPNVKMEAFQAWTTFLDGYHDLVNGKIYNVESLKKLYSQGLESLQFHLDKGTEAVNKARIAAANRVGPKIKNYDENLSRNIRAAHSNLPPTDDFGTIIRGEVDSKGKPLRVSSPEGKAWLIKEGWLDPRGAESTGFVYEGFTDNTVGERISFFDKGDSQIDLILKGDTTPITGRLSNPKDGGKTATLTTPDGNTLEIHTNLVDSWRRVPEVGGGSAPNAAGNSPISTEAFEEISRLRNEYTELYGEPPRTVPDLNEAKGWNMERAKAKSRELQHRILQEKNRLTQENYVALNRGEFEGLTRKGGSPLEVAEKLGEDTSFGWLAKLMPTYARHGLSANPAIAVEVRRMLHQMEEWGKNTHKYLTQYREAMEELAMPMRQRMQSMLPGQGGNTARMAKHKMEADKIKLARMLDGDEIERLMQENPHLQGAYTKIRGIFDELADEIGLPKEERISNYFPHIFHGTVGEYMAKDIAGDLGSRGKFMSTGTDFPEQRLFTNLLERKGAEGFELDLDAAVYAYVKGAVKKPGMDDFLNRSKGLLEDLPFFNNKGGEHTTRRMFNDYVRYLSGQPGAGRKMSAQFWQNNKFFNHWVDRAVGFLGEADPNMSRWLAAARRGDMDPSTGQRGEFDDLAELEVRKYFKKLVEDANMYTKEGEIKKVPGMRRHRAALALKVEEIRNAIKDPKAKPMIISNLYGMMVVNKLGLNISHGMINLTQTLTNTMPEIGITGVARGIARYAGKADKPFSNGKTTKQVLDDLGVLTDTSEAQEFIRPGIGWYHEVMDGIVMSPARITEKFNRGVAGLGSYEKAIAMSKTHDEAITYARDIVLKTQFPFNKAGVSPVMQTPMARFLLMFKSYPMHQLNFSATLLENAIRHPSMENSEKFAKHILAYVAMAGVGASALGGTNFGWKAQHPINDFADIESMDDVVNSLGGPPASVLLDLLHGQIMSAAREVTVSEFKERVIRASHAPSLGQATLETMGMAR